MPRETPEVPPDPRYEGAAGLFLVGLPFLAMGFFVIAVATGWWRMWWDARGWTPVPMTIQATKLATHASRRGSSTVLEARYRYQVATGPGATIYTGTRVSIDGGSANASEARQRYEQLAPHEKDHTPFTGYVNAANPAEAVLFRDAGLSMLMLPVLGFAFALVGGGLAGWARWMRRRGLKRAGLVRANPDRPWRWEPEWADGFAVQSILGTAALVEAGFITFVAVVVGAIVAALVLDPGGPAPSSPLSTMLGLVPLLLFARVAFLLVRRVRYGTPRLELERMPLVPGGALRGKLLVPRRLPEGAAVRLELRAREVTGSGKRARTVEVARADGVAGPEHAVRLDRSELPVSLAVPQGPPRSLESGRRLQWFLTAVADGAFRAEFELPVYVAASGRIEKNPAP